MNNFIFQNLEYRRFLVFIFIIAIVLASFSIVLLLIDKSTKNRLLGAFRLASYIVLYIIVAYFTINIDNPTPVIPIDIHFNLIYFLFVPLGLSIAMFVVRKKVFYLIDAIACLLVLPAFFYVSQDLYLILVSVFAAYSSLAGAYYLHRIYHSEESESLSYLSKKSLDLIDEGIFLKGRNNEEYMNEQFAKLLDELNIFKFQGMAGILSDLRHSKKGVVQNLSDDEIIIEINSHYHLLKWSVHEKTNFIYSYLIDAEMLAKREIEENKAKQLQANAQLKEELIHLREIEADNQWVILSNRIHDLLGQRIAILQKMLEDDENHIIHLKSIKEDISGMYDELKNSAQLNYESQLKGLEETFGVIGFKIEMDKEVLEDISLHNSDFIALIREASTNAISHAKANALFVQKDGHDVLIFDSEKLEVKTCRESTGLKSMRKSAANIGYEFAIDTSGGFLVRLHQK